MENREEEIMISNNINNIEKCKRNGAFEELVLIQNLVKKESALKELCKY